MGGFYHSQTPKYGRGKRGKVNTLLNQELEKVKWGEYRIEELFERIKVKSLKYKTADLPSEPTNEYVLPALTAGIQNQGLNNFVPKDNATILKNVISISANGANTGVTFYQNKEFTVLQDAYAVKWKDTDNLLTDNQYLYLTVSISKAIFGNYEWTNKAGWEKVKNQKIQLPTKDGKIDFDFMDSFVTKLEKVHLNKLEAYLIATGLLNYDLTVEEEAALEKFKNGNIDFGKFKIDDLFTIQNTLGFNKDKLVNGEEYDYVTRTSQNQGILQKTSFVNQENINSAGNWSLGLLQMDFFYRHKPWYAGQFIRKITSKIELDKSAILYFTVLLNKQKQNLLSVLVRDVDSKFLNAKLNLPVFTVGEINFEFIKIFISAIQKMVIKDVVLYANKKLEATK